MVTSNPIAPEDSGILRDDWFRLVGHTVEIWQHGEHLLTGVVDEATSDDSILWIAGEGPRTRRLYDKLDGISVRVWPTYMLDGSPEQGLGRAQE